MHKHLHSVSMLSVLSLSLVSFVPGSLLARTDCPHSIRLNDLKKIAKKNEGDKIINTIGEEWTIESETKMVQEILTFLEDGHDPTTTDRKLVTILEHSQHIASMAHSGAKMEEKLVCRYSITGTRVTGSQLNRRRVGVTMSYYHPD